MKERLKNILKYIRLYHPMQSSYRAAIFSITKFRSRQKYHSLKGPEFTCNVCGVQYREFIPDYPAKENAEAINNNEVIAGYGENILCPSCLSTARERLVIAELSGKTLSGLNVLHLSPERNVYSFLKKQRAVITTADLLPGFYKTVDGKVEKQDATKFTYHDKSFGLVIANHILEHIPADTAAMAEIFRVLKPGGQAILQVPYSEIIRTTIETPGIQDPKKQSELYGQQDHVRIYKLDDYIDRLKSAGFKVTVIPYFKLDAFYKYAIQDRECFLEISRPVILET